ncbi:response regulator transcription factor [Enterococcus sp. AZ194]|uniref:response regulator transcription factor n=1 Tax=Enterococcus sp. AZ194 TaxID=2774629 RepID=UPI003F682C07
MEWNLLIIDDEKIIREGMANYLPLLAVKKERIFLAATGQQALDLLEKQSIQVAFVDINLPDMNGLDLIQLISQRFPKILMVVISGFDEFEFARRAIQLQVFDYLLKPVPKTDLEKMIQRMNQHMEKSQGPEHLTIEENEEYENLAQKGKQYIERNYTDATLSLTKAASSLFVSGSYLSKQMKETLGYTFSEYLTEYRLTKAKELLANPELQYTIAEIARKVGYKDQHYFSRLFKKVYECSPLQYQKKQR